LTWCISGWKNMFISENFDQLVCVFQNIGSVSKNTFNSQNRRVV